jgi:CheY-like chemotaxis protein
MRILLADDDADDRVLAGIAFSELNTGDELEFVNDGEELMEKLHGALKKKDPLPDIIVLDLNMPRKDGRSALKEMKAHPVLRSVDVVVFSTSNSTMDRDFTMALGARDYAVKPSEYSELVEFFRSICEQANRLSQ